LDIRTELQLGGTWTDVSSDVYLRDVKQITRGLRDQGSAADPTSINFTLNNKGGKYSRRNAMSPLYGLLMQNTPVRVNIPGVGDSYLQLDGTETGYAYTADKSALDITGDLDVRVELAGNWYGPTNQWLIGKWGAAGQQSWALFLYQGLVYFRRTSDGTEANTGFSYWTTLPALPERAALRAVFDADDGTGRNACTFYWADSLSSSTWNQIGNTLTGAGVGSIFASTAPLQLGIAQHRDNVAANLQRLPMDGRVYRAEVRNGIAGSVVASPDFRALADRTTSQTDAQANVWALSGNAEIRDREDRFMGEIAEWPLKWTTGEDDVWTPVQANGIMRRLGQGAKALDSALRRRIPSGDPVAYWPLEESQDATRAYSPIPGVFPASMTGVDWAGWSTLPSSLPLPKLSDSAAFSATVPPSTPGAWQIEFVYNADDNAPVDETQLMSWRTTGIVSHWEVKLKMGRAHVLGYSFAGVTVVDQGIAVGADIFHGWTRLRFWAQDDADGVGFTWRVSFQDVGGDAGGYTSTYATGTCGMVSSLAGDWTSEATQGWGIGHIFVLDTANSTLIDGSDNAFNGESAWKRMMRLASEEGIKCSRMPGLLDMEAVGYQRDDSLLSLFEAAAGADGGLLTEDMHRIGLHYRDRSSMYTQTPQLELSYLAPGLGADIEPVDDDTSVVNDVTVTRDGGSSARAVLDAGPLSVQSPPNGIGRYDSSYTLSLGHDEQTEPIAYWKLHQGTWDAARYPTITLMLHKPGAESLIPAVLDMREGDKIRVSDLPEWVSHEDVDLIVLGWSETLDMYRWELELNCVPAGPWDTAVADHPTYGQVNTDGSELTQSASTTATSLVVKTTSGPTWTEDPADMPVSVRVAGEVMSVTGIAPLTDTFTRTTTNGWGTSPAGDVWTTANGSVSDYDVNSGLGRHVHNSVNVTRHTLFPAPSANVDIRTDWNCSAAATGATNNVYVMARYTDTTHLYFAHVRIETTGGISLMLRKRNVAETQLGATITTGMTHSPGTLYTLRFEVVGSTLRAKVWLKSSAEPANWQITATDTDLTAVGSVGFRSFLGAASTATLPVYIRADNFQVLNTQRFTVQRSVNGVVKAQPAGTAVSLATPAITSL
jgi:hypothetical protein